jgi:hypothetical protein
MLPGSGKKESPGAGKFSTLHKLLRDVFIIIGQSPGNKVHDCRKKDIQKNDKEDYGEKDYDS